jgi:hypothetical protein
MSRRTQLILALTLLGTAILAVGAVQRATAGIEVCNQVCVMIIEVDGLTPDDLTAEQTPFLWDLARQNAQGTSSGIANQVAGGSRNGYLWQAPRGVMSAGSAPAAASLLTGGYPEQHGIPADEYIDLEKGGAGTHKRFVRPKSDGDESAATEEAPDPIESPDASTIFTYLGDQYENSKSAWISGDPGLTQFLAVEGADSNAVSWSPSAPSDSNTAFCPIPRTQDPPTQDDGICPADDAQTLNQAGSKLTSPAADDVAFTYIHLAGVGQTKLRDGNVASALQNLELELGNFIRNYSTHANTKDKWAHTVLMVVGSHGYEHTPTAFRVPDPSAQNPTDANTHDLEHYLEAGDVQAGIPANTVKFVPQGTFGTVYVPGVTPEQRKTIVRAVRARLLKPNVNDSEINAKCAAIRNKQAQEPGGLKYDVDADCIKDVLFVDRNPDNVPTDEQTKKPFVIENSIESVYKTWRYDHYAKRDDGKPEVRSGTSGELVVTAGKGWAFGRAATVEDPVAGPEPITNAYPASAGGPRNRAIAAFINGPERVVAAMNRPTPWHPVTKGADTGDERQEPAFATAAEANANPGDDANAVGHELQPETVDFMPTAAALLKISVGQRQLVGRLLTEAFELKLKFEEEVEDIGEGDPDEPEPPAPPPIIIPPPPPPPDPPDPGPGYDFHGLLRKLRAQVIDADGKSYAKAKPSSLMSHMVIKADFGKPLTMVTLTFYREVLSTQDRTFVRRCSTLSAPGQRSACLGKIVGQTSQGLAGDRKRCEQEEDASKKQACRYEVKTRGKFEKQKKRSCVSILSNRLRRARSGQTRVIRKALNAPCLVPLAKFDPFTVKRGQVELKLKVPTAYSPSQIGMTVQEVRKMTAEERTAAREDMKDPDKPLFPYVGFGRKAGTIVGIADADQLHHQKPGGRARGR